MLGRLRSARLIWPTILTLAALALLVSLGNWQWRRLAWKNDLISQLEQGAVAEPISLQEARELIADRGIEALRFRRVRAVGQFEHEHEFHVWAGGQSGPAWTVITPLTLAESLEPQANEPVETIFVIRGTVPQERKAASERPAGQIEGSVEISGRIRLDAGPNWAAGDPNTERNEWFSRDLTRMSQVLAMARSETAGSPEKIRGTILPFAIEAERSIGGPGAPEPDLQALTLSNRHFEYALTWWGLAAALVAIYLAFVRSRLRVESAKAETPRSAPSV